MATLDVVSGEGAEESGKVARAVAANRRRGVIFATLSLAYAGPVWFAWIRRIVALFRTHSSGPAAWRYYVQVSEPIDSIWISWPLIVAAALAISGWSELLPAVTLTFVVLFGYDLLGAVLPLINPGLPIWIEPLRVLRLHGVDAGAHLARAAIALWGFSLALRPAREARMLARQQRLSDSRPAAITGRLLILGNLVFAVLAIGSRGWTVFEEVGLRHRWLVSALADTPASGRVRTRLTPQDRAAMRIETELTLAMSLMSQEKTLEARRALVKAISSLEALAQTGYDPRFHTQLCANAFNNLAWLLATCADESQRDPARAVEFARKSLELVPGSGNTMNTLAVAYFRNEELAASEQAFAESMARRGGGDAHDWFFLAMIAERGRRFDEARAWFERAVSYHESELRRDPELHRFHTEAAAELGLDAPPPLERADRSLPPGRRMVPRASQR